MNKSKISLPFKGFVVLMAVNMVMTGIVVLMADDYEAKYDASMFGLMIFSIIFIGFMIYVKEALIKEKWSKVPVAIKFIWWFLFTGNAVSVFHKLFETFIYN
ncbi:hypothetical protein [Priestia megaterium]|uniref:hypothetical protein n=1 Tax=Priestia megaterium TaxID=1404 RepID=UPI0039A17730